MCVCVYMYRWMWIGVFAFSLSLFFFIFSSSSSPLFFLLRVLLYHLSIRVQPHNAIEWTGRMFTIFFSFRLIIWTTERAVVAVVVVLVSFLSLYRFFCSFLFSSFSFQEYSDDNTSTTINTTTILSLYRQFQNVRICEIDEKKEREKEGGLSWPLTNSRKSICVTYAIFYIGSYYIRRIEKNHCGQFSFLPSISFFFCISMCGILTNTCTRVWHDASRCH